MNSRFKYRVAGALSAFSVLFLFAGCLTSESPFYNPTDPIEDPHFVGTFVTEFYGLTVTISDPQESDICYTIRLTQSRGGFSEYQGCFFRIREDLYLDLTAIRDKDVVESFSDKRGVPTISGLLKALSYDQTKVPSQKLHLLFKVSYSDRTIDLFGGRFMSDPADPLTKIETYRFHANGEGLVLEENTTTLQSILRSYGADDWKAVRLSGNPLLSRKTSEAEPGATANPDPGEMKSAKSTLLDRLQPGS